MRTKKMNKLNNIDWLLDQERFKEVSERVNAHPFERIGKLTEKQLALLGNAVFYEKDSLAKAEFDKSGNPDMIITLTDKRSDVNITFEDKVTKISITFGDNECDFVVNIGEKEEIIDEYRKDARHLNSIVREKLEEFFPGYMDDCLVLSANKLKATVSDLTKKAIKYDIARTKANKQNLSVSLKALQELLIHSSALTPDVKKLLNPYFNFAKNNDVDKNLQFNALSDDDALFDWLWKRVKTGFKRTALPKRVTKEETAPFKLPNTDLAHDLFSDLEKMSKIAGNYKKDMELLKAVNEIIDRYQLDEETTDKLNALSKTQLKNARFCFNLIYSTALEDAHSLTL